MDLCNPTMGFYRIFTFLLLYSTLFGGISGGTIDNKPGNCREVYDLGSTDSGEKILYTASGKQFKFYCHVGADKIYGLLHKDIFEISDIDLDITKLYDHMEEAMIGFFDTNHTLYQVRAGRLDHRSSEKRPVIMWNSHHGFGTPNKTDTNYLYLGFYDNQESQTGSVQGIHVINENRDCFFTKFNSISMSYIAFYGENGRHNTRWNIVGIMSCVLQEIEQTAINAPADGYSLFGSIQFGGSGSHRTTDQMTDYDGMNFIFMFDYATCSDLGQHNHTERSGDNFYNGSTVNYSCVIGSKYSSGNWSMTCMGKSGWSGQPLVCMPSKYGTKTFQSGL